MLVSAFWSSKRPLSITFGTYDECTRNCREALLIPGFQSNAWLILQTQGTKQQEESVNDDASQGTRRTQGTQRCLLLEDE
jgi:hypothetical protein